jgi:hypothetical protein
MNKLLIIPTLLILAIINNKRDRYKCEIIPVDAIEIKYDNGINIHSLFMKAINKYKNNGLNVKISQYDLFHCHVCHNEDIVFHAKEYPKGKHNLGFCQEGSTLSWKNFDKRNLVFNKNLNKWYFKKHTDKLLYYDCNIKKEYFIDPNSNKTYLKKYG